MKTRGAEPGLYHLLTGLYRLLTLICGFSLRSGEAGKQGEKFGCLAWQCQYEESLALVPLRTSSE